MTRKQKFLAKIRAWIDTQLPRDVLAITIQEIEKGSNPMDTPRVLTLFDINHMEQILRCKYSDGPETLFLSGDLMITFRTEHLR